MPVKSKQQFKYIYAMRRKYKSKKKAPKNMKWVFNKLPLSEARGFVNDFSVARLPILHSKFTYIAYQRPT